MSVDEALGLHLDTHVINSIVTQSIPFADGAIGDGRGIAFNVTRQGADDGVGAVHLISMVVTQMHLVRGPYICVREVGS